MLLSDSKPREAVVPLRKALEHRPDDVPTKAGLGLVLTQLGQFQEAITILESAYRQDPGNDAVNQFLRVSRSRQQGLAELDGMKRYALENPTDIGVRLQLFKLLGFVWRMDDAEVYAEEIRKLDPDDPRVFVSLGTVYNTVGDHRRAEEAYRKALDLGESAAAYLGMATLYRRSGQPGKAINAFEEVLKRQPDSPNIMILYAEFLLEQGKRREALGIFKRSLALQPLNAVALFNAGVLSARFGDLDSAKVYLESLRGLGSPEARSLERCIRFRTVN